MKASIFIGISLLGAQAFGQEVPAVRTVKPTQAAQAAKYEVPGRTEPIESATIFTRATGIINERKFEIGDTVQRDVVLATVAAPEIDRAVEAAAANVEQARARANNAKSLSNRSSRLLRSDVVSEEESEQRQTAAVESAAGVRVAEAELARLEEQQRFSTVRAPFEGVITARNFDRGDLVRGDSASAEGWLYQLDRLDTRHHNRKTKQNFTRKEREHTVLFCSSCHKQVHALLTEKELEKEYNTVEKIATHPEIARFVEWVQRQPPGKHVTVRTPRERR